MAKLKVELELTGAQEASKTYKEVLKAFKDNEKELKALAIVGDTTSKRYQELAKSVGGAKAQIDEANRSITAQKGTFDLTINALGGAAAGYAALRGAAGLFGAESENLQKSLLKVQSALALAQGLKQFQEAIPIFKTLSLVIGRALVGAFSSLRSAIISTGIGLLVVAAGFLIAKIIEWTDKTEENEAAQEKLKNTLDGVNRSISETNNLLNDQIKEIDNITTKSRILGETEQSIFNARKIGFADAINNAKLRVLAIENEIRILKFLGATEDEINKLIAEKDKLIRTVAETQNKASNEELSNQKRLLEVEERNQRRRTQLIRSELGRRLQELRDNYNKERREAIKNGEDLNLIERKYQEDRSKIVNDFAQNLEKDIRDNFLKLNKITIGSYVIEEEELKRTQQEQKKILEDKIKQLEAITVRADDKKTSQLKKTLKKEEELLRFNKVLLEASLMDPIASGFRNLMFEELDKVQRETEKTKIKELFRDAQNNKAKIDNQIETSEKIVKITKDQIETISKLNRGRTEEENKELQRFKLAQLQQEELFQAEINNLRQEKVIQGLRAITKIQEELGVRSNKFNEQLLENEFKLFKDNELRKIRAFVEAQALLDGLTAEQARERGQIAVDGNTLLFDEVFELREENIKRLERLDEIEKENTQEKIKLETQYYQELEKLQNTDIKNVEKFNTSKLQLDRKLKLDQLLLELKNLDVKIKLYGEDTDEFKKFQLEKIKIQTEINEATNNLIDEGVTKEQEGIDKRKRALESYAQESINILNELQFTIGTFYDLDVARFNAAQDKKLKKLQDNQKKEVNNYALTSEQVDNINRRYALAEEKLEEERAKKLKEIEKQRADTNFAITIGQIVANTGLAVMRAFADLGPVAGIPAAALIGVASGLQITAAVNQRNLVTKLEDGGLLKGASHNNGGIPIGNTGVEVEGGEFVVNRQSTQAFLPLIEAINNAGRTPSMPTKMQNGGMLSNNELFDMMNTNTNKPIKAYVVNQEITSSQVISERIRRKSRF